jgi:methyl-accepting chemotaxis protein
LVAGFAIVAIISLLIAYVGYANMKNINANIDRMYSDSLLPITHLEGINQGLYTLRGDVYKALLITSQETDTVAAIQKQMDAVDELVKKFSATDLMDTEKEQLAIFDKSWAEYKSAVKEILAWQKSGEMDKAIASLSTGGRASESRKTAAAAAESILALNLELADQLKTASDKTFDNSVWVLVIFSLGGFLTAMVLGLVISDSLSKPLELLVKIADSVSKGELLRELDEKTKDSVRLRQDEVGAIGKAFDGVIMYMQTLGDVATRVAKNDLTVVVTPKSGKDEVGVAFVKMILGLREAVGQVASNAFDLAAASAQLAAAAGQAGQATTQIATTVQEVAKGITQQSASVNQTAFSVEQMGRAISGVAAGAQEQAAGITRASTVTTRLNDNIHKVAGNAEAVTRDSGEAARAARAGSKTVEETIRGMQNIKAKVGLSAQKVQEMGMRSDQIGVIIETIDDIASQTNLLALNAAIEAARAGDHGKGFAVVADEVRKLAERSSVATKEIGELIKQIQKTVTEAVTAMQDGATEVEGGVRLANSAGNALSEILKMAEAVYKQSELATAGVVQMRSASSELVTAVESVSAVIEENTASTEEMAAGAREVTRAIETIASISEQSSASVEQVSASAEEMSGQVESVTASAQALADMAANLKKIVARFQLA